MKYIKPINKKTGREVVIYNNEFVSNNVWAIHKNLVDAKALPMTTQHFERDISSFIPTEKGELIGKSTPHLFDYDGALLRKFEFKNETDSEVMWITEEYFQMIRNSTFYSGFEYRKKLKLNSFQLWSGNMIVGAISMHKSPPEDK